MRGAMEGEAAEGVLERGSSPEKDMERAPPSAITPRVVVVVLTQPLPAPGLLGVSGEDEREKSCDGKW